MKKFIYEKTVKQQAEVICYAFSADLIDASESELRDFLKVLSSHFPKTDNGDGAYKPIQDPAFLNTFNNAYSNVCNLIEDRRIKKRHDQIFWISIFTLLVLVATLVNTIYTQVKPAHASNNSIKADLVQQQP